MYSHIIGMDEELWDILEEGVGNLRLHEEGVALPHKEYLKMSDKSTAKAMFTSLCANYKGNKKGREAKATMLVHQFELFRMKEHESIETMY